MKQIFSIVTIDIVLNMNALVHLYILMLALQVVVMLLASITSACAIEFGRILRPYRAPRAIEFSLQSFAPCQVVYW